MGNIRPTYIKSISTQLIREMPSEFGSDFDENKKKVEEFTNIDSKRIRNRVAGYITHKMRGKVVE